MRSPFSPPSLRGVLIQAKWVYLESTEQATTLVLMSSNSSTRSLKARISVGQTKVLGRERYVLYSRMGGDNYLSCIL